MKLKIPVISIILLATICQCRGKVQERKDELYSRHLQKKISVSIFNTPVPANKSDFNLLILSDGTAFQPVNIKDILKELTHSKAILPLIIISVPGNQKYFGIVGDGKSVNKDRDAEKYVDFLVNELLPFAKKQSGVRKFKSVALAGIGKSAIASLDAGWDNADKFDKVGIFQPVFTDQSDTSMIYRKIKSSRKRPKTAYWFYLPTPHSVELMSPVLDLINEKVHPEVYEEKRSLTDDDAFSEFLKWAFLD